MPYSPADFAASGWRHANDDDGPSLTAFTKGVIGAWLLLQLLSFVLHIAVPDHSPLLVILTQVLLNILWTVAIIWFAMRHQSVMLASLRAVSWRVIAAAFLGGIVLMSGDILVYALLDHYRLVDFHKAFDFPERGIVSAPFLIAGALTYTCVPVTEEIVFRGAILTWLARKMPTVAAIIVSSLLFALVHLRMFETPGAAGWIVTAGIFVIGTANAVLAVKTRSLWPCIFLHAAANATYVTAQIFLPMR